MEKKIIAETTALVARDFEIEIKDEKTISEEELLEVLSQQVAYMLDHRLDFLLSLMYRLDVYEEKINQALSPHSPIPPHLGLAHLILERQNVEQRFFVFSEPHGNSYMLYALFAKPKVAQELVEKFKYKSQLFVKGCENYWK